MKKRSTSMIIPAVMIAISMAVPLVTNAQMMGNSWGTAIGDAKQTAQDEAAGKAVFDKLQSKQATCANLSDDDFDVLGDYYMGAMMGSSHAAMNAMMQQRWGESNERLMHIAMGKRLSGCDATATFPANGTAFLPMMGMMGAYYGPSMMGYDGGFGLGWIPMILWWILIIVAVFALVRWLAGQSRSTRSVEGKQAVDILKERYAKGEIDKKEFEEKKKDIGS